MSGDCFVDEFPTCDCLLFAHFLEIWSAEQIRELLVKAHRALVPGGKIYLIDLFQEDDETGPASAAIASAYLLTLATGGGMAYTLNEYSHWLRDAGFSVLRRMPLTAAHGLIIAIRDGNLANQVHRAFSSKSPSAKFRFMTRSLQRPASARCESWRSGLRTSEEATAVSRA